MRVKFNQISYYRKNRIGKRKSEGEDGGLRRHQIIILF